MKVSIVNFDELEQSIGKLLENDKFLVLQQKILDWADDKGILEHGNPMAQAEKTLEETYELIRACEIQKASPSKTKIDVIDAIGDIMVTLIIQAKMQKLNPLDCLETAYNEIKHRKGKMINGTFVKNK